VNEENSRQAAATSTRAESGTLSVAGSADLRSGPTNVTVHGKRLGIRGTGQVKGKGSLTSARQQSATISYGDVRNLKHRGPSIRYRAELHVTVRIASADFPADAMPEVAGDIVATIRIPKRQQAGFEFAIREALSPSGSHPPATTSPAPRGRPGTRRQRLPAARAWALPWSAAAPARRECSPRSCAWS